MSSSYQAVSNARNDTGNVSYVERKQGNVLVAVVDVVHNGHGCLSRPVETRQQLLYAYMTV